MYLCCQIQILTFIDRYFEGGRCLGRWSHYNPVIFAYSKGHPPCLAVSEDSSFPIADLRKWSEKKGNSNFSFSSTFDF
uniref:Uncharacterized protein n=1 Tax=Panagrolaimus sp. JU765 TaxID=591449 RepID=A0AC34RCQ9_9BILA